MRGTEQLSDRRGWFLIWTVQRIVTKLSGRRNKSCYYVLSLAVEAAWSCLPEEPKMGVICAMVQARTGMSAGAVSKALSRVTADIWDYGDREKLHKIYGHSVAEKPTPKALVFVLAVYCQSMGSRPHAVPPLSSNTTS